MNYLKITCDVTPVEDFILDLLASHLGEIGFESFEIESGALLAYIPENRFDEHAFQEAIRDFSFAKKIQYTVKEIEQINWNEAWERNYFSPILIEDQCLIHSSFHKDLPSVKYDIIIDPKMSFGTGHHETTGLMVEAILKMDNIQGKTVLDMGCGTAVLSILAAMRGASSITAIDIDTWCVENAIENIQKNGVTQIDVKLGDAALLKNRSFDVIFANINKNILIADLKKYAATLHTGGILYMSGFYSEDIPAIAQEASIYGLKMQTRNMKDNWAILKVVKTA